MNSTPNKFTRFLKNNAALLLIIFCVLAIAAVVLAVTLTDGGNNVLPDDDVVINPNPDEPDEEKPTVSKVYFASPVDYTVVTMDYTDGEDVLFVFNKTLNNWSTHFALDLAAAEGTDVLSMYDGTVVEVSESYGMGNTIKIDHGDNVVATYASLGEVSVVEGQQVQKGEKIGVVSTTASYEFSDGAHLHLEVTENGNSVDPTPYVKGEIFREVTEK